MGVPTTEPVHGHYESSPLNCDSNEFPGFPIFYRLLGFAHRKDQVAIDDVTGGFRHATYSRLVGDILSLRNALWEILELETREKLNRGDEVFFNILAQGGYEYATAFFAILAIGGVIVPLSTALPAQEASYFARKCDAVGVLTASTHLERGRELHAQITGPGKPGYAVLEIKPYIWKSIVPPTSIRISSKSVLDYNGSGIIIYTSGTTGPPKGTIKRRAWLDICALNVAAHYGYVDSDVLLHMLPVHHVTGIGINFLPVILTGGRIEFQTGGFNEAKAWERLRLGGITILSVVPTIYMRMMRFYESQISQLPQGKKEEYLKATRSLRIALCGTSALPRQLQDKWSGLLGGKSILERFGASEVSGCIYSYMDDPKTPVGSVGRLVAGVEIKLSENEEQGEMLIKTPNMFTRYVNDDVATASAFTSDGYYKSGDIARREGPYYFIMGRASVDIIKSGGYKISALDIEREIIGLDYAAEVMVVGVEDEEFGQRVSAAVVLRNKDSTLTIDGLRKDLREHLAGYKMPTILRVVEALPKTASGKVLKKELRDVFFPKQGHPDVQRWESKKVEARL